LRNFGQGNKSQKTTPPHQSPRNPRPVGRAEEDQVNITDEEITAREMERAIAHGAVATDKDKTMLSAAAASFITSSHTVFFFCSSSIR
jgi:hypothetical protein